MAKYGNNIFVVKERIMYNSIWVITMYIILYNPLSKSGKNKGVIKKLEKFLKKRNEEYIKNDILAIADMKGFINNLSEEKLVILGGDGTIHYVLNFIHNIEIKNEIYFWGAGTGNDFSRNVSGKNKLTLINPFLKNLPTIQYENDERVFINGTGMGIDAFVCEYVKKGNGKSALTFKINTIKAFLKYKPVDMKITVDGVSKIYKKVWLSTVMNGVNQGGGIKFAPDAIMNDGVLDICIAHSYRRIGLFLRFPFLVIGHHKWLKNIELFQGKEIIMESEVGLPLQMDGEIVTNIRKIVVRN